MKNMILDIEEYKMLITWFRYSKKYCTKMMNNYKVQDIEKYNYWKGQKKAFTRSLYEVKLSFK